MATYYHGTHHSDLPIHAGLCLTPSEDAAADYGSNVHSVEIDLGGLNVERLWFSDEEIRQMRDDNEWPCDRDSQIAEYVARGVDAIIFDDASGNGAEHKTLRLLSDRALAAVAVAV
jgi:hypothetical protein